MTYQSLRGYTENELKDILAELKEKPYRSRQLYDFLFNSKVTSWSDQTNLPKQLIENLKKKYSLVSLELIDRMKAKDQTVKYLYKTHDDLKTESVVIRSENGKRVTACLSSQVGCKFACRFCVSGSKGLKRDLGADEIVDQLFLMQQNEPQKITNIVMMGMGEPFDNYEEMVKAIKIIHSKQGFNLGARNITISTVGLPQGIDQFAKEGLNQIKLAISLHAANDELREKIMPVNKKHKIKDVVSALKRNKGAFKRTVTFEYILFKGINDSDKDAKELARLTKSAGAKINLIVYNPTGYSMKDGTAFERTSENALRRFRDVLTNENAIHTLRRSGGSDIGAACGQLSLK